MKARHATLADMAFWVGVVTLAALLRWPGLAASPLGATEADLAARAWDAAQGLNPPPGPGGWLTPWLAGLFFLTGPREGLARLLPALAGALFPLLARAWEPLWGRRVSRAVALGWAVDPVLVAASRLVWGPALALTLAWAAWGTHRRGRPAWAWALALAALAAGPTAGWALLFLAVLAWGQRGRRPRATDLALPALLLFLLATTGLQHPAGLGGWAEGLVAWMERARAGLGVPRLAGLLYAAPVLLWAGLGWARGRSRTPRRLAVFAGLALVLWMLYPGRQAADLAWVHAALWPWAAQSWLQALERPWPRPWPAVVGLAAALSALAGFVALTANPAAHLSTPTWLLAALLLIAALAAALLMVLVHQAISPAVARRGAWLAALVLTGLWAGLSLSHAWRAAASDEFWQHDGAAADLRALEASLTFWGDRLGRGASVDLEGVIVSPHPALRWLRASRFPRLEPRLALMPGEQPPVVLTGPDDDPGGGYRGQRYRLSEQPVLPDARAWARWFVYRQAEVQAASIILWVREDLFAAHTNAVP